MAGKKATNSSELCSLTDGFLMNSAAMRLFCKNYGPEVSECEEELPTSKTESCLMRHFSVGCTDITKVCPR